VPDDVHERTPSFREIAVNFLSMQTKILGPDCFSGLLDPTFIQAFFKICSDLTSPTESFHCFIQYFSSLRMELSVPLLPGMFVYQEVPHFLLSTQFPLTHNMSPLLAILLDPGDLDGPLPHDRLSCQRLQPKLRIWPCPG